MQLPPEIWWKILLECVVDTALLSESPSSLNESISNHARVCCTWSSILHEPAFKREAKYLLYVSGAHFCFIYFLKEDANHNFYYRYICNTNGKFVGA